MKCTEINQVTHAVHLFASVFGHISLLKPVLSFKESLLKTDSEKQSQIKH